MNISLEPRRGRSRLFFMRVSEEDLRVLEYNAKKFDFERVIDFVRHSCGLRTKNLSSAAKETDTNTPCACPLGKRGSIPERGAAP